MKKKSSKGAVVLIENIPPKIKSDFKSACARRVMSMREVIIAMMIDFTEGMK